MKRLVDKIETRILGRTGLKVKVLGVGGICPQEVLEKALEYGLNFYDVHGYKDSNGVSNYNRFKNAFKKSGLKRSDVVTTARTSKLTAQEVIQELEETLEALDIEYIDLYGPYNITQQPDRVEKALAPGGTVDGLEEAKKRGLIRFIGGVSGHHHMELAELLKKDIFDAVMLPINILDQDIIKTILPLTKKMAIGTIAMKPFAKGIFTQSAGAALKYALCQNISVAIPGMMTVDELGKNIKTASDCQKISEDEIEALKAETDEIIRNEGNYICRQCGYCVPVCPRNIDIKELFYMERQANRYYSEKWAIEAYSKTNIKADTCVECGSCEKECPYDLPIREMLKKVHREFTKVK